MKGRLLRIGWIVMLIVGFYWFLASVFCISGPARLLEGEWEQIAGQSWAGFVAANSAAMVDYVEMGMRLHGIAQLAIAALVVMVTLFAYRKGQRWSWYALLAGGIIYWVGMLIHHMIIGAALHIPIIGLVLLIIALAIPAKDILTQKST